MRLRFLTAVAATALMSHAPLAAQSTLPTPAEEAAADRWAATTEAKMTDDERIAMVHGFMPLAFGPFGNNKDKWPKDVIPGAGYAAGVSRLGVPSMRETDASLGVTNPFDVRKGDTATALPGSIALGATFDPDLAYRAGHLVGEEAKSKGFNVLLGGGINLLRDPRNGRNFEYISEDPLLSGLMGAAAVRGSQDAGVVSTVKHFALNSNETNRFTWDAVIDEKAFRESDLLAFELAIKGGRPGSVMCAYNLVNGSKACGSDFLLNQVLKRDWGYKGWVMSDWGAVAATDFAVKGLDQQSGEQLDKQVWFGAPLKAELEAGTFPRTRLSDMVRRILRSMKVAGAYDRASGKPDMAAHGAHALTVARAGIVLLKNEGDILPLANSAKSIVVIGEKADTGVLSGGGSSQGTPPKGWAASNPVGGMGMMAAWRIERWFPGSPLDGLRAQLPDAKFSFDPGQYPAAAALAAKNVDLAIVFVTKHEIEGYDSPDLSLPRGQDAMVAAVAAANPNTIVVIQSGNPISMPWRDKVKGIIHAWYPGQEGGQAIAEIISGKVNPSGRLPITFPASLDQLPRPEIPSYGTPEGTEVTVKFDEGADVGYRWFARKGIKPMYAFGYGQSYTSFAYSGLKVTGGNGVTATFTVKNTGTREGADVPQLYLQSRGGKGEARLLGFQRITLAPGESRSVTINAEPKLLADWDTRAHGWRIPGGRYRVSLSKAADAPVANAEVNVSARNLGL